MIKVSHEIPPIFARCHEVFGVEWGHVVITYGDTVYAKYPLTEDIVVHEATHVRQQAGIGVEAWWEKYFMNEEFRLNQEVEAYRNQVQFIRKTVKDRNQAFTQCHKLWQDMERMYGGMCTYREAKQLTS